jgi:hypothetical protein
MLQAFLVHLSATLLFIILIAPCEKPSKVGILDMYRRNEDLVGRINSFVRSLYALPLV